MIVHSPRVFATLVLLLASRSVFATDVDFNRDIRPIISGTCIFCHGPDEDAREAGLRLDTRDGATADLGGYSAVLAGDAAASELIARVTSRDPDVVMPPPGKGRALTEVEVDLLRRWIDSGAEYARHWSYVPPVRSPMPTVTHADWPINGIDPFVLQKIEAESLAPSPPADRTVIARRVSLALLGLPPTPAEVELFMNDPSPDAYEKFVGRLLSSPRFGERWAHVWLDLARYADSAGYADDPARTIFAYRDYVIRSLNENIPFDQFTIEQIAGDLIEKPTESQLIATAFHRNTMTNNEGGTNDEQFRNEAIVDRVNTTMAVWMGTTMACAQCHTHKYDPITQAEYFQFFDLFNQSEDADQRDEAPIHELWTRALIDERNQLDATITETQKAFDERASRLGEAFDQWLAEMRVATKEEREKLLESLRPLLDTETLEPADRESLVKHYQSVTPELEPLRTELQKLRDARAKVVAETTVPIMRDLPEGKQRTTHVQLRGSYTSLGDAVTGGVPAAFHPLDTDAPMNRLGVARWLVSAQNPLTARVVVNRYWEELFGVGLVESSEEFGSQGEPPSHPELLDWLAVDFVESGWDVKRMISQMVLSATYRQSSEVTKESVERDPSNRFLARGPRFRISAEMVRDQSLFVAGLLSDKMFGPPVNPPQPQMGLAAAFGSGTDWVTSPGDGRYRRALYTSWRRSNPYPSMSTFDAPNREVCTVRRLRTNTPLQALVTMNDPVYVEAAQSLARRVAACETVSEKINAAMRNCLQRSPSDAESTRLIQLHEDAKLHFAQHPASALPFATKPLGELPAGADAVELAALTLVAGAILNLDEMVMPK